MLLIGAHFGQLLIKKIKIQKMDQKDSKKIQAGSYNDNGIEQIEDYEYDPGQIEFSVVLLVKDINKSIEFYCGQMGFIYQHIEATSNYSVRVYLKPFESANVGICLEQFLSTYPRTIDRERIYFEVVPGRGAFDYDSYCNKLKSNNEQLDSNGNSIDMISILRDPDQNVIRIEDGFDFFE